MASALAEGLATFATFKGVQALGRLRFCEGGAGDDLPTLTTPTGPLPRVCSLVAEELCALGEGFSTLVAHKGLYPGVNLLVLSEVFIAVKCFLTFVTLKGFLIKPWMLTLSCVLIQNFATHIESLLFSGMDAQVAIQG